MLDFAAYQVLDEHLNPYFHGRPEYPVHGRAQPYPLANPHGMQEAHLVHRRGYNGTM